MEDLDKVLVYLGPSLPLNKAREILPEALYRPPAKQGDILSDVINLEPNIIILVDGVFASNLSPWHKEICFALQYPGVKGIYGASSMGALRASECDFIGMVGIGRIYEWYRDGVTEDDSEVALLYSEHEGLYFASTVPLINIRAAVTTELGLQLLAALKQIPYAERTPDLCQRTWIELGSNDRFPYFDQKAEDAAHALARFRDYEPKARVKPTFENLSQFFEALYDRDRRISVAGQDIIQQHIDAHVLLHNPEQERICWDSANQELALILCNMLSVMVAPEDIERESQRFQIRAGVETAHDFEQLLSNNGWNKNEYNRLMIENARIHKLQHALTVTKAYRRNTAAIIKYLRTHQAFDYWALQALRLENRIEKTGVDDWLGINLEKSPWTMLQEHAEREGLEIKSNQEEYLLETGFCNPADLGVALARINAGKEQDG